MKIIQSLSHRKATKEDLLTIIDILCQDEFAKNSESKKPELYQNYVNAFQKIDSDPNQYFMIVESDNKIVAFCQLTIIPYLTFIGATRMQIETVRVAEKYRGQKIGEWMMNAAIAYAKEKEVTILQLTTNKMRIRAKNFYEKLGFEANFEGMRMYLK